MSQFTTEQATQNALDHYRAGRLGEAEALCRHVLATQPRHADALNMMGLLARRAGDPAAAIHWLQQAIAVKPHNTAYLGNLGNALRDKGRLDDAVKIFRRCVALSPAVAAHYNNLGLALRDQGHFDDAVAAYRQALELKPDYAEPHQNLALVLSTLGRLDEAIAAYRQAIRLKPDFLELRSNLAKILCDLGQFQESIELLHECLAADATNAAAHSNLGNALSDSQQLDAAIASYRRAIELDPDYAEAHANLALALLLQGDFQNGWPEYEWRWKCDWSTRPRQFALLLPSGFTDWPTDWSARPKQFARPQWSGPDPGNPNDLTGRTFLLHAEQGFGDTIQFIRYAPLLAARGARVVLLCWPQLARLLQNAPGISEVVLTAPPFDIHCPLLSLPLAFGTTLASIPAAVPYLQPNSQLVTTWAPKMPPRNTGPKVGLVWAGSEHHKHDRNRSLTLAQLGPLAAVPNVTFFSLQKGPAAAQATQPPPAMNLLDLTADLHDFADTAALISHLDLVITVDTAVAHLAGALAKPVWILLPFAPDWRWLLHCADSPWYPTARLFRQNAACQWDDVIQQVAVALTQFSGKA